MIEVVHDGQRPHAGVLRSTGPPASSTASRKAHERRRASWCLGVAYKQDIDDYRESPALRVIEGLEARGAKGDAISIPRSRRAGTTGSPMPASPISRRKRWLRPIWSW